MAERIGSVFERRWPVDSPAAVALLLHGFGEHTDHYVRLASALNSEHIDVWSLDHIGHGRSAGERGIFGTIEDLATHAERVLAAARRALPDLPMIVIGHSLGGIVGAYLASRSTVSLTGLVLTGTPFEGLPASVDEGPEPEMSRDPSYLEDLANDPLGFDTEPAEPALWEAIAGVSEHLRDFLTDTTVPVLLINGEHDVFATPEMAARWAELSDGRSVVVPNSFHDIPNDVSHAEVAAFITSQIQEWVSANS